MKNITLILIFLLSATIYSQVTLEKEIKITDLAMYFDGDRVPLNTTTNSSTGYDYVYGTALTPHGDCIKVFGDFVFLTWYRGGKNDRHVMLTRYNQKTGVQKTIEFPHQHTGYNGRWWIGETHNTIAVGISPKNGTIHMVYDMHRNGRIAAFANDYLRYSYTTLNAATVPDDEFTIDLFVQSPNNNYKHLRFPGITDDNTTKLLTYPAFFTNDEGDLFMKNRFGFSENGKFLFAKYDGNDWEGYTDFNRTSASSHGSPYNWGLYGDIKYFNGKIRIGFQQRANVKNDKYQYQNGFYYAYSDDPSGLTQWKDHEGTGFTRPLAKSDLIKISEPGDLVETTAVNQVYMVQGFDWTVTDNEDIHFIGRVKDNENNVTKQVHTYKPAGANDFITSTDFSGAEAIYAAGDKVYLIGLNSSGRPFVEEALGGTNLFTRVYEQTSGKRFRKGQVYISDGKLYYYLLENNTTDKDDTQPTYLQIIDLNVVTGPQPFAVNLVTPTDNQSFWEGEEIQLYATATADEGEITKVEFLINNVVLQEDTTKPYLLDWTPDSNEIYKLKAVAYKTNGESISTSEITIDVKEIDKSDLTLDTYRLRNVATGKFLTDAGNSAIPVTMGDSGKETNTHWTFVKTGGFYNIDSESFGILRATGSGFDGGNKPFFVVSTGKASPANDTDKIWQVYYNESDDTFRFEAGTGGRFLYHNSDGAVNTSSVPETDERSKWKAIPTSQTLSITQEKLNKSSIAIFPNPARENFTLKLNNLGKVAIKIYNYLGKVVYNNTLEESTFEININGFSKGLYLVNVTDGNQNVYSSKLMIE
ncbi:BNR-4 repeat-containing protein [uncultured Polaribacter sp.]|uniref:BNR-4 repeat-containing protein n=1 Tax=uncultured Polaribacter sp. TaxID=174711 RepID=UPI002622467F|nr:BNR-4 repeat-containing protein [uncultured Polaribacter sp.]